MKITLDTSDPNREDFINKITQLAKKLDCYGPITPLKKEAPKPLSVDELLRLEVVMHSLPGVVCALSLSANPEYEVKRISTRELAYIFKDPKIKKAIDDYVPHPTLSPKKKRRPTPYED